MPAGIARTAVAGIGGHKTLEGRGRAGSRYFVRSVEKSILCGIRQVQKGHRSRVLGQQKFADVARKSHQKALKIKALVKYVLNYGQNRSPVRSHNLVPKPHVQGPIDELQIAAHQVIGQWSALSKGSDAVKNRKRIAKGTVCLLGNGVKGLLLGY